MSDSFNTGKVHVDGTVTAAGTFTASKMTPVILSSGDITNSTSDMGTVPANKRWIIVSCSLMLNMGSDSSNGTGSLKLNNVEILQGRLSGLNTASGVNTANALNFDYTTAPILTAGQKIQAYSSSANVHTFANVVYIEESV